MMRTLLATTALAGVLATGAFAQDAAAPAAPAATTTQPAADSAMSAGSTSAMTNDSAATGGYMQRLGANEYLASDIDDETVYVSDAADADSAGEIQNFVVNADGTVTAVVIDTSFLDADKTVAVPFNQVKFSTDANNVQRAVLNASRDQINAAPAFTSPNEVAAATSAATDTGATGSMAAGGAGAMGTTGTMGTTGMTAGDTAMAPATAPAAGASDSAAATTPAIGVGAAPVAGTGAVTGTDTTVAATGAAGTTQPAVAQNKDGYLASIGADQYLSADLIGETIYSGPGDDAETIGSVNDLVIGSDGKVNAMIVGVGGFLGIGEKDVGVPFDQIAMTQDSDGDELHATLAASREQLTAAPAFDTDTTANNVAAATNGAATTVGGAADNAMTTANNAATATGAAATGAAAGLAAGSTDTTASTGGQNPGAMTPVTGAELTADNLIGTSVYGPDNQTIGSISDLALTADGKVDAVIVDVGGFLGIGAKPVAVAMDNLQFMKDSSGSLTLTTQFTQDQLKNAPEYNRDTYAQNRDTMLIENAGDMPAMPAGAANGEAKPADTTAVQ